MRKLLFVVVIVMLALPVSLMAQDYSKAEVFGGYSYQHVEGGINLNGWNAAVAGNVNPWLGFVADFGGYYGNFHDHTFLFGPQFSYRGNEHFTPFFHTLFGVGRESDGLIAGQSDTAFAMAIGGGVDYNVSKQLAFRVIQADYLMTKFSGALTGSNPNTQNDVRLSFGIVARF